jgi:hypothetical protein
MAHELLVGGKLPKLGLMTHASERFGPNQILEAIKRADDKDSLKVIVNFDNL